MKNTLKKKTSKPKTRKANLAVGKSRKSLTTLAQKKTQKRVAKQDQIVYLTPHERSVIGARKIRAAVKAVARKRKPASPAY